MSVELKRCPFCGGTKICTEKGINLNYCDNCSAESNVEHWNTRPIEDGLQAEIEKLKKQVKEQPTTNCSKLGSKFTIKQVGKSEGYVIYRENEFIGGVTFGGNDKDVYVVATRLSPSELRELADLVEDTPEVK